MFGFDVILWVFEVEGVDVCFGILGGVILLFYDVFVCG